jgi:hypothetical protein
MYLDLDVSDFRFLAINASIWICVTSCSSPCHHHALVELLKKIEIGILVLTSD